MMSKAIDDLKHEHEAILAGLKILDSMIDSGEQVPVDDLNGFIGFLKEFADKCHHGKEEDILFPALTKAGLPVEGGPVGVMLSEHVQGREYIQAMESAVADSPDYEEFAKAGGQYAELLRQHIQKENNVLFVMAEKILSTEQLDEIFEAFEKHEEQITGHGRHDELHTMLESYRERYGA